MNRAGSTSMPRLSEGVQPATPCKHQNYFGSSIQCCTSVRDGCSTAEPSPRRTLRPSSWVTPWQGLASNGGVAGAPQGSIVIPKSQVCYSDSFGFDCEALTAPPPQLTQADWLSLASALSSCGSQVTPHGESTALAAASLATSQAEERSRLMEQLRSSDASQTPPMTPRKSKSHRKDCATTAPGAPKKLKADSSQLSQALQSDSVPEVMDALSKDPDAAWTPFWECQWEPPLCWAARNISDPAIISLLLEHGANVNAADSQGRTPLSLLIAAAELYPCSDELPRWSGIKSAASFIPSYPVAWRSLREDRAKKITWILTNAGAIVSDRID